MGFLLSFISPSMNCFLSIPTVWLTLRSILLDVLLFNRIKLEIVLFWYSQHFLLTYRGVFSALMSSLSFIPSTIRMLSSIPASVVLFVLCSFIILSKKSILLHLLTKLHALTYQVSADEPQVFLPFNRGNRYW